MKEEHKGTDSLGDPVLNLIIQEGLRPDRRQGLGKVADDLPKPSSESSREDQHLHTESKFVPASFKEYTQK
jgi:hypothetical protein